MGLSRALHDLFAAHPALALAGGPVRVGPAPGRAKEGVDLHARADDAGRPVRAVVASVLPGTLAEPALLARRLHREAAKTADLLDPVFGWSEEPPEPTPARRESVRLRYRAAWDAWTDGRLERRGLPAPESKEEAAKGFVSVLGGVIDPARAAARFEEFRAAGALTHSDLLRFARNPDAEPGAPPSGAEDGAAANRCSPLPGSACPFCRFPTHDWIPEPRLLAAAIQEACRDSLPGWSPDDGICGQCALLFRSRAVGPGGSDGGEGPEPGTERASVERREAPPVPDGLPA